MRIDPKIEQPTRSMLGHAMRHQLDDLADAIRAAGNETFTASIPLCVFASGYIAINISERWPTDADLQEIAKNAAESGVTQLDISQREIYEYLSRVALGPEGLDNVFSPERSGTIPLYATANLLLTFCPRGKEWWEYLDQIWAAAEAAENVGLFVLPALMLRAHKKGPRSR
jgi:hypothetical protein